MRLLCCTAACSLIWIALATRTAWSVDAGDVAGPAAEAEIESPLEPSAVTASMEAESASAASPLGDDKTIFDIAEEEPWDYSPYRVLIWLVCDDPRVTAASMEPQLRPFLNRDFFSLWRFTIADAPASVRSGAHRDIDGLSYHSITEADPVLAIKRDHPDAVRIRIAKNVGEFVSKVYATKGRIDEVQRRATAAGNASIDGVADRLQAVAGDANEVAALWVKDDTEGVLVSRGMALTLTDPEAKLITPNVGDLVGDAVDRYDKIFVVRVHRDVIPHQIEAVEFDTLMRHFGPVAHGHAIDLNSLPEAIGRTVTRAFAPIIRIENAGQRNAVGLLRASGLVLDKDSPAAIQPDDVLVPMTRKNDRNGKPILIGPIDWAYLLVTELEGRNVKMDYYAGRAGGLQGRKNKRTFRTALKVRPFLDNTVLRLHLRGDPDFPLIGYELYEKELKSTDMTFIGRTDWNGRLLIERSDDPFRLLYVKNGGAVLARLPLVPGLNPTAVADLSGDDMRLQAEAYIRGVQNSIIDLVAIRKLFEVRILMRLEKGEVKKAEDLLLALEGQPSSEKLADEIGKKQQMFIEALGTRNANQRRKVDEMFTTTRQLLESQIHPRLIRELRQAYTTVKDGGSLPKKEEPPAQAVTE